MDSPFGSLDESYQKQIAQAIPALAPQVVIFVSKSQGLSAVQEELAPRVGKEYVAVFHTPKADSAEAIGLHGKELPYIRETNGDQEWAVLEEV
jgi:DNA sulfur modification protein DndD